jgi:bifunctional DNA-binding transcriptional regulator/antitoxin component of YhaV-PrlF toxin-antitoxin module
MGNRATYTAEYLSDGHLSIPQEIANKFSLKNGKKIRVIIEASKFNKADFLKFFGIWKQKNAEEIAIFKGIFEERKRFGRGEIKL